MVLRKDTSGGVKSFDSASMARRNGSLQGHLLIAHPQIDDGRFARAVIVMCTHDDQSAMGVVINHRAARMNLGKLYETLDIPKPIGPGGRYDDSFIDLLNNNFFKTPNIMPGMILKDKFINMPILRDGINRSKDLQMQMIMRAQNDQSGINAVVDNTPIARLKRMDYTGIV